MNTNIFKWILCAVFALQSLAGSASFAGPGKPDPKRPKKPSCESAARSVDTVLSKQLSDVFKFSPPDAIHEVSLLFSVPDGVQPVIVTGQLERALMPFGLASATFMGDRQVRGGVYAHISGKKTNIQTLITALVNGDFPNAMKAQFHLISAGLPVRGLDVSFKFRSIGVRLAASLPKLEERLKSFEGFVAVGTGVVFRNLGAVAYGEPGSSFLTNFQQQASIRDGFSDFSIVFRDARSMLPASTDPEAESKGRYDVHILRPEWHQILIRKIHELSILGADVLAINHEERTLIVEMSAAQADQVRLLLGVGEVVLYKPSLTEIKDQLHSRLNGQKGFVGISIDQMQGTLGILIEIESELHLDAIHAFVGDSSKIPFPIEYQIARRNNPSKTPSSVQTPVAPKSSSEPTTHIIHVGAGWNAADVAALLDAQGATNIKIFKKFQMITADFPPSQAAMIRRFSGVAGVEKGKT